MRVGRGRVRACSGCLASFELLMSARTLARRLDDKVFAAGQFDFMLTPCTAALAWPVGETHSATIVGAAIGTRSRRLHRAGQRIRSARNRIGNRIDRRPAHGHPAHRSALVGCAAARAGECLGGGLSVHGAAAHLTSVEVRPRARPSRRRSGPSASTPRTHRAHSARSTAPYTPRDNRSRRISASARHHRGSPECCGQPSSFQ